MSRLLQNKLDEYTRFALPLILSRFPEWEALGIIHSGRANEGGWAEFKIPCPSPAVIGGLWVTTEGEELTVGFHTHHNHFNDYSELLQPHLVELAADHAKAILEDRIGVVSVYDGERFAGSVSCELPHVGPLQTVFRMKRWGRVTLRSWSGRHDRDEAG